MKAIDNKELIIALEELEKEKGIKKEELLESIRTALITAYKRNFDALENVDVKMDEQTGATHVYAVKEVMESLKDEEFIKPYLENIIDRTRLGLLKLLDDKNGLLDEVVVETLGFDILYKDKYELVKNITSKDICDFANRLVLDTIYFIEEEEHE